MDYSTLEEATAIFDNLSVWDKERFIKKYQEIFEDIITLYDFSSDNILSACIDRCSTNDILSNLDEDEIISYLENEGYTIE